MQLSINYKNYKKININKKVQSLKTDLSPIVYM